MYLVRKTESGVPGTFTPSMALCLAENLVETRIFDPVDQLDPYLRWYRTGNLSSTGSCFDIGNTVWAALMPTSKKPNSSMTEHGINLMDRFVKMAASRRTPVRNARIGNRRGPVGRERHHGRSCMDRDLLPKLQRHAWQSRKASMVLRLLTLISLLVLWQASLSAIANDESGRRPRHVTKL